MQSRNKAEQSTREAKAHSLLSLGRQGGERQEEASANHAIHCLCGRNCSALHTHTEMPKGRRCTKQDMDYQRIGTWSAILAKISGDAFICKF